MEKEMEMSKAAWEKQQNDKAEVVVQLLPENLLQMQYLVYINELHSSLFQPCTETNVYV